MKLLRRTWANVDLDNLEFNCRQVRQRIPAQTKMLGVIKADAYGHGAVPVARALTDLGTEYLAVSNLEEAIQLRRADVRLPILILGHTPPEYADMMVFMDIVQEVHSLEYARELEERLHGTNYILNVHVKLDTGMTRIGFSAHSPDLESELRELSRLPRLRVAGAFTHFSVADSLAPEDEAYTAEQYRLFEKAVDLMGSLGIAPEIRHCCNSGGLILHPEYAMDMVRPGIVLYGVHPSADTRGRMELRPVMSLHSTVAQIRKIPRGTEIGYGRTYTAERDLTMAVIPIGYADGLSRRLSGRASFLLRGQRIPLIGRICMDMCMADISQVPDVQVGDTVTIFGDRDGIVSCDELAEQDDTIAYELLCAVNKRIPRIYLSGGKESNVLQYIV